MVLVALTVFLCNLFLLFKLAFPGGNPLALSPAAGIALGAVELLLVIGVWYASLRASHRIAGPVYVLTREIRAIGEGDLTARIRLRDKDMFSDAADDINSSLDNLAARVDSAKAAARELQAAQAAGVDCSARLGELVAALDKLRTRGEG